MGYIRVSRVGGRGGEAFIAPEIQRERIAAYATAHGHTIIDTITDLDESGGKINRPGFQTALARCESGEADGIIVAKLDRFARSLADAVASIERLRAAGCELVSVADNLDATTSTGKFARTMLLAIAELERERISESWDIAREKAIARGVHATSRAPFGYVRDDDGRLMPDPVAAAAVGQAFERRAAGETITEIGRFLDTIGGRTFTNSAVRYLLSCRTYLGQVRSGDYVNKDAHEPLVSLALFEAANARKPVAATRRDSTGEGMLLSGLLRCAGCRRAMSVGANGQGLPIYRCKVTHASGKCTAPASVSAELMEQFISEVLVIGATRRDDFEPLDAGNLATLEAAVTEAEAELSHYVAIMKASDPAFRIGYDARVKALNTASADLAEAARMKHEHGADDWPSLSMDERRRIARSKIQAIFVKKGGHVPPEKRTRIVWQSDPEVELPKRGVPSPLIPFEW